MALWAIIQKDDNSPFNRCDPVEAEDGPTAAAIALANSKAKAKAKAAERPKSDDPDDVEYGDDEWPELTAMPLEQRNATRPALTFPGATEGGVSKHWNAQRRKVKPRKPGKRWS